MTQRSKNHSAFSSFINLPGISSEWQEISATFTTLLQKTMVQNMKQLAKPAFPAMKAPPSSAEWKNIWKKVADETQKAIAQNMKNFVAPSLNEELKGEWEKLWKKVGNEIQKTMAQNMQNLGAPSLSAAGNAAFDPEALTKTFRTTMAGMTKKPEKLEALRNRYREDFQELLESTLDNLQEKITEIVLKPEANNKPTQGLSWMDNPFLSLIEQSYRLNTRFIKETMEM
ncbi:MAG: hypothetical protein K0R52_413 [Alphaproteobacteria bacterium]|jgi:hypothetical protein|nr:hypothetical protein [Alphaproteobacteria bacterium]